MQFQPIQVKDKLGRTVILRSADPSDAADLIRYLKVTAAETRFLAKEPEEITLTQEEEVAFLTSYQLSKNQLMLIATLDGKHIGNCSFSPVADMIRYRHRCSIGIALYEEYCGCGIGGQMLTALLAAAKSAGFEQAELEVVSENKRAIALYEKLGFARYGTFPNNMKYPDGTYASADWMMKIL